VQFFDVWKGELLPHRMQVTKSVKGTVADFTEVLGEQLMAAASVGGDVRLYLHPALRSHFGMLTCIAHRLGREVLRATPTHPGRSCEEFV
jgi:hypothetical protein